MTDRQEWLQKRKKGLGGTDASAVLGLNPYRTAYDVYLEKIDPEVHEIEDTSTMQFGRDMEDVIARRFAEKEGVTVSVSDEDVIRSKEHNFILGSIDRFVTHPERGVGVLEIKTVGRGAYKHWASEIPPQYYTQLMQYLYVTGYDYGVFAIFITDSRDIEVLYVDRSEEFIKKMVELEVAFWNENVLKQAPPEPVLADMDRLIPVSGSVVEAEGDIVDAYADLVEADQKYREAEKDLKSKQDVIKQFMVDHEVLSVAGEPEVTWRKDADGVTVDTKKLKGEHPDVYAEVLKVRVGARKFLLKKHTKNED